MRRPPAPILARRCPHCGADIAAQIEHVECPVLARKITAAEKAQMQADKMLWLDRPQGKRAE